MNRHRFYRTFISPRAQDVSTRNREIVVNWLLVGSLILTAAAFINTFVSFIVLHDTFVIVRLHIIAGCFLLFAGLLWLSRRRQHLLLPSLALLTILFLAATAVAFLWGILDPNGIALFCLVIVMSGILLNARASLYTVLLSVVALSAVEFAKEQNAIHPDLSWERDSSRFTDVVSFGAIFVIIALTSWLFNRSMEAALRRAQHSEAALKRERDSLEETVEERTRALQAAQLEQVQEVYRFAELGHLSTALFHDLANHIMSVSIDVAGLQRHQTSVITERIQTNVRHIDTVVKRVRQQIQGKSAPERFNVASEIQEIIKVLEYTAKQRKILLSLEAPDSRHPIMYRADLTRFRQVIINLLSNAMEAYPLGNYAQSKTVEITLARSPDALTISVIDHGNGIRPAQQAHIFEPFYSTKEKGMGIGLFIVRKVVEEDFHGNISLMSNKAVGTVFSVNLPLAPLHGKAS